MRHCQRITYPALHVGLKIQATYCHVKSDPVSRENTALETNDSANGLISHRLRSEGGRDMAEGGSRRGEAIFV